MRTSRLVAIGGVLLLALLGTHSLVSSQQRPSAPPRSPLPQPAPDEPLPETLNQVDPQILLDGDKVYRLWVDEWAGLGRHIRFQRSDDGGKSWPPEALMLDRQKPEGARSSGASLALGGSGRLMVTWRTKFQGGQGKKEIQFVTSTDQGRTWTGPRVLNRDGGSLQGQVTTDGQNRVYAVWDDERATATARGGRSRRGTLIFFNKSDDAGKTWLSEEVRLSPENAESFQPRIRADRHGRVFVMWLDTRGGTSDIYFRASEDHGKSWGPEINITRGGLSTASHQFLTDGNGRIFLVWSETRLGPVDVFFARSDDGGKQWTAPMRLSHRPVGVATSTRPHMALTETGTIYVAWQDRRNGREDIYLNASSDGGKTWLDRDLRLDRDEAGTGISLSPYVVTGGPDRVAVLWEDDRDGLERILLNRSLDGGRTWLEREIRVDTTTEASLRAKLPRAAWDSTGTLHAVWEVWKGDVFQGERRVDYRRLPLSP